MRGLRQYETHRSRWGPGRVHAVFREDRGDALDQIWWLVCDRTRRLNGGQLLPAKHRAAVTCRRCARALGITKEEESDMSDPNQFLKESRISGYPNASFDKVGDSVEGTVTGVPRVIDSQYGEALVVDLANPAAPEGGWTLWIKKGQLGAAVAEACGDHGLAEGGFLKVTLIGERDTGKPSPLKVYAAEYNPPQAKVDVGSLFGQGS